VLGFQKGTEGVMILVVKGGSTVMMLWVRERRLKWLDDGKMLVFDTKGNHFLPTVYISFILP